ncbi:MAG: oligosaccharide flippase family protein [Stigonema ocellatum SAG 48.90 = DSM 106950]|nr:oligosaccharide flippase family protein [Stigonema ocellatum SAG 48.90 = DSM 106950]
MTSLKKLAIRGAVWTIISYGASQILRFGSNLCLTHLLVPEFFGLMAVVNTLRMGIELFSDLGVPQSIVSNPRGDDPAFLNTAWTINIIRSLVLGLFFLVITFPVAQFYHDQRLLWLTPIVGLSSAIYGFTSTAQHTLHRRLELGKLTAFDLTTQVLSLITMLVWAWLNPSIWALGIGGVVLGSVYAVVCSYWLIPGYSNHFAWDRDAVKDIRAFGRWMLFSSGVTFLNEQADRLILAKLLSFQVLGVYTVANSLAAIPREIIKQLSYKVIFPTISNQLNLPRASLRAKIISKRKIILIGFAILLAVLVSTGDLVIALLYDKRYSEATWMMPILCCGVWFSVLFYTLSPALLAIGKPLYLAQSNLAGFLTVALGLPLAFSHFGILGAITLIAVRDLPLYIVNLYGLWQEKLFCISQDIQSTALLIGVLALLLMIRNSLGFGLPIQMIL